MSKIKEEVECFLSETMEQLSSMHDKWETSISKDDIEYHLNQIEQLMYKLRKNTKGL